MMGEICDEDACNRERQNMRYVPRIVVSFLLSIDSDVLASDQDMNGGLIYCLLHIK